MPNLALELKTTDDLVVVVAQRGTLEGFLFSLVVHISSGAARTGQVYVEAGTYTGQAIEANILSQLVSGYAYTGRRPSWHGQQPIEKDEGIYLMVRANTLVTVRAVGKVLRFP